MSYFRLLVHPFLKILVSLGLAAITQAWSPSSTYQQLLTVWWVPQDNLHTRTLCPRTSVPPDKCSPGQNCPDMCYPDIFFLDKWGCTVQNSVWIPERLELFPGMSRSRNGSVELNEPGFSLKTENWELLENCSRFREFPSNFIECWAGREKEEMSC